MVRTAVLLVSSFLIGSLSINAQAQELSHRNLEKSGTKTYYSPSDIHHGGIIYRIQTGQAGLYRLCNDDSQKRYSPYIEWHEMCKQKPGLVISEVSSVFKDAQRKVVRWNWGKAACSGKNCN